MTDPPLTATGVAASTVLTFSNSISTATLPSREINEYILPTPEGDVAFRGILIGFASSHQLRHKEHQEGSHAARYEKCSACRWFEVRIFRLDSRSIHPSSSVPNDRAGAIFAVHTQGPSLVPGEFVKCRLAYAQSGYEVVELLTVRKSDTVFLPAASSRALAQAAGLDRDIETAYVNRAVA